MIYGFDTETYEGYAKLLSCSNGTYIESSYSYDYIDFLYKTCSFTSYNIWYNLGFDFGAIMKEFFVNNVELLKEYNIHKRLLLKIQRLEQNNNRTDLENENLSKLKLIYKKNKTKFHIKEYIITRIGDKSFSIQRLDNKRLISFFDVASFYAIKSKRISLDEASKKYLNETKNADELKISAMKIGTIKNYYEENRINIIKYCKKDAYLTYRLFILLLNAIHDLNMNVPEKFFSKASITKALLKHSKIIVNDIKAYDSMSQIVKSYAKNSFHGGLFKINYVGNFKDDVYNLDINSAYPTFIKKINGLSNSKICFYKSKYFKDCFYKFYKIECKANPLFASKLNGMLKYVYTNDKMIFYINELDKKTLDLYKIDYTIIEGIGILTTKNRIYKKIVDNLYNKKKDIKVKYGKNSFQYMLVKTIANSLYGITAEQHPIQSKFTNFIYASYITSYCRNYINGLIYKIESAGGLVLTIETDGIIYKLKDKKTIAFLNLKVSKELGDIEIEPLKEITIFENGIQQQITMDNKIINKTRGFQDLDLELLRNNNNIFYETNKKVVKKVDSCIIQQRITDLNLFLSEIKIFCPYQVLLYKYKNDEVLQELQNISLNEYFTKNFKLSYNIL